MESTNYYRKCGSCKKEIPFGGIYQQCSISSCKKVVFCSVTCWDVHNSIMNHKSAWAEEEVAPKQGIEDRPRRRVVVSSTPSTTTASARADIPRDILIVASKLKNYVKARYDMNTSGNVMDALSDVVRHECDKAVEKAKMEGRKTLMDRDF